MIRYATWIIVWLLALVWCLGVRRFVPGLFPIEPYVPFLVASLMLGPLRLVIPLILVGGLLLDVFQPFPHPIAFFVLLGLSCLIGLAIRFVLASRSFYSALILVLISRILIALAVYGFGAGVAVWPAEKAVLSSPLFLLITTVCDAILLLIAFRLVARPLLGAKRVQIAR